MAAIAARRSKQELRETRKGFLMAAREELAKKRKVERENATAAANVLVAFGCMDSSDHEAVTILGDIPRLDRVSLECAFIGTVARALDDNLLDPNVL